MNTSKCLHDSSKLMNFMNLMIFVPQFQLCFLLIQYLGTRKSMEPFCSSSTIWHSDLYGVIKSVFKETTHVIIAQYNTIPN